MGRALAPEQRGRAYTASFFVASGDGARYATRSPKAQAASAVGLLHEGTGGNQH